MAHSPLDGRTTDEYTTKIQELLRASGVTQTYIDTAGTGYSPGDAITVTGDGSGADIEVATVGGSGEITGLTVEDAGSGYTTITLDASGRGNGDAVLSAETGADNLLVDLTLFDEGQQQIDRLKFALRTVLSAKPLTANQATVVEAVRAGL